MIPFDIRRYATLFGLLILLSCEEEAVHVQELEKAVLEGFLHANSPVEKIHIKRLIPYGAEADSLEPVNDLDVHILHGEESYPLIPSPGDSGLYHYPGEDLLIKEGQLYGIRFNYSENEIFAETLIPSPPQGLALSTQVMQIERIDFSGGFPGSGNRPTLPDPIEVSWQNPSQEYYFVVIENIEKEPESIFENVPFRRNFSITTSPTTDNIYLIQPNQLEQYGTHRVILFKVNEEYVNLYATTEQDSRNLNEPLSNVENGLGIFTAFNSDTVMIEVIP